ncbi:type IV toxin-antitoxin system AbiEi family antitoxin domain-containing protein [Aquisphaera insulae]|uniref:type IV toxin-antitoxin system AbiEi family antitoxin domain-containing protein n=1 Tax=Aquisphaera insulae TaxID=2712864 RepID=UPI0013ED35A3|nr:type IV toxin-antitoxin system AbiEi family antitoxin domain-containing protein [Aquisphaera insulae]
MPVVMGPLELQLLAYAQSQGSPTVKAGEFVSALNWTPIQERQVLSRLAGKGILVRVRPGLYLVPPRLPPGGRWSPGEPLALETLMKDCGGRYQISGPNAFHRYGWNEQVPNRLYVYNDRISGDRRIGPVSLTLIKVTADRLGSIETVRTPVGIVMIYASKARALVDAVQDWSRFDTLPRSFDWITSEIRADETLPGNLVRAAAQFGNMGTVRRIGMHLERLEVQRALLRRLESKLRPSSSLIPWDPTRPKRGKVDRRWGVIFNDG